MECNRDEASRAKTIAERKLTERDFLGAKKFALKAQSLYPGLEGLSQLKTALDVYISAEIKISGEADWYGILGVSPLADDESVRKQYRKLALMLHPDKNNSVGAEGAFKLISEAWGVLSDKPKRLAYNQRRSSKGFQQSFPAQSRGPLVPPRPHPKAPSKAPHAANGFHKFTNHANSYVKTQNNSARAGPTSVPQASHQRTNTFWTICHRCKMHYEYLRMYLNQTLLCPNCKEAFLASEVAPPFNIPNSASNLSSHQRPQNPSHQGTSSTNQVDPRVNSFTRVHQGPLSRAADFRSTFSSPSTAAMAANVVQQANKKVKRDYEEAEKSHVSSSVLQSESLLKKRSWFDDNNGYGRGGYVFSGFNSKPNATRELTMLEFRNMLMEKARREIRKKLTEWSSENIAKAARKRKESQKEQKGAGTDERSGFSGTKKGEQSEKSFSSSIAADTKTKDIAPTSVDVPDPDFHDFDQDRTERCFTENQVWASYDGDDGMPRLYAMIHKVISLKPFKMRISRLNSRTTKEFGSLDWVGSGFTKTCGDFRVGKYENNKSLNSFSHKVKWSKGPYGAVSIYPRKGDIWALYRNWSPDWNDQTPDEVVHKYDMVEVLDDYNEDQGVSVTPLIKVVGFRTVFKPQLDKATRIRKEEMFRFSHQVPNYLLTGEGEETQNAPKGCQELDPAATPLELLQKITEIGEIPTMENCKEVKMEILRSTVEIKSDENMDTAAK